MLIRILNKFNNTYCFRKRFGVDSLVPVGITWKDNGEFSEEKVLV